VCFCMFSDIILFIYIFVGIVDDEDDEEEDDDE